MKLHHRAKLPPEAVKAMRADQTFMYEDDLPANMTNDEYDAWFANSFVDGVRMGPVFYPRYECPRCYRMVTGSCGPNCAWDWEKKDSEII